MNTENEQLEQALLNLNQAKALNEKQAQQIAELVNRYQKLEQKHEKILQKFEGLQHGQISPSEELKSSLKENHQEQIKLKETLSRFVKRLIETSKIKSKYALKLSLTTLHIDSFITNMASQLSRFSEKLTGLEINIQGLSIERPPLENQEAASPLENATIKIGAYDQSPQHLSPSALRDEAFNNEVKTKENKKEGVSKTELPQEKKNESSLKGLPEDFRPILENTFIQIDSARMTTSAEGIKYYSYSINQKYEVVGMLWKDLENLSSIQQSDRMHVDAVNRLMSGEISVDDVFLEAEKNKMIHQYRDQKKVPNAFEKRMIKAEQENRTERIVENRENTKTNYRSR
ncbi:MULTISPECIES: hypothetical protein [unclassified Lactococcus]|uniref:hypothetical protein n=1 Tax=unclassified Lactococcus TaxID=2643510 RepID=UPI0011CB2972|nr:MULTISPECIES: hypothetical protein [unclassified Lactococcus]MQW23442.1 hypothetical protein [Lactococcus sp. dk101]TXK37046.1 hypothetical protein FVP42_09990 [Lactococcus sp. dk310]TXK37278.1 hypothetical protein FVP42_09220 [Lactococcus sp. dk310]TXK46068.1 hypothetical protein FVP43_11155 [Lactococcus sp. dk322]